MKKLFSSPWFIFSAIACIVFWPLTFQLFTLKNDALTYYYPIRTLISDALNNGELPLWTPYLNMGYPLHADMQSGAWNPVIWIFSFFSNYSLAAFHVELLLYISLAGTGFYYLCREIGNNKAISLTTGAAYMLSGFIIDSIQFFNCISSAAYISLILLFFLRANRTGNVREGLITGFFLYLLFTGGYPSLFIITCYILAALLIYNIAIAKDKRTFFKKIVKPLTAIGSLFILLSLPAIISFVSHLPHISRGGVQPLPVVLENSMNPSTLASLITPFSTTGNDAWMHSNILMRNIYIGIIPLIFLIYTLFNSNIKRDSFAKFCMLMSFITIGLAFGGFFFFRQIAYYILPMMDSFRHPALFRLFTIIFILLLSARAMQEWRNNSKMLRNIILALIVISISVLILCLFTGDHSTLFYKSSFKEKLAGMNFQNRFLIQFPFIIVTLLLAWFIIIKKYNFRLLLLLCIADLFFAAQLNIPVTIIGAKKFDEVESALKRNPLKFPMPGDGSLASMAENTSGIEVISGSSLHYEKRPSRNDYFITPGNLKTQEAFYWSAERPAIFEKPLLYFEDYSGKALITSFSANQIKAKVNVLKTSHLIYLQNFYPGWKVFVDNEPKPIAISYGTFMSLEIQPGEHTVEFRYRPATVIICWYVSVAAFFLFLFYLLISFRRNRSTKHLPEIS